MTTTLSQFLDDLPPALSLRGPNRVPFRAVAQRVRQELAAAARLGVIPAGTKLSVTTDSGTLHSSLRVRVTAWDGAVFSEQYAEALMRFFLFGERSVEDRMHHSRLSDRLQATVRAIETIAGRHNYDESDSMVDHFDVGYYLTVDAGRVEAVATQGLHVEASPAFAGLVFDAQQAAKRLGPKVEKSVCGDGGVGSCGEYSLRRLVEMDARVAGRPVAYDKRMGRWQATTAPGVLAKHNRPA